MTRKRKLMLNTVSGLVKQAVAVICGFILPRYMLVYYGSSVNGLVTSITHFLGFISLLEMGIGPVIQANLYEPLARKDKEQVSKIIISSERFFRRIGYIFLGYIAVLAFLFPRFINDDYGAWFTISLLLIISISTAAQYFFGITYQLLLNADQLGYIQISLQIITIVMNTVACVILMKSGASVHTVKLLTATIYLLRPLGQSIYVRKHYDLDKKIVLTEEPIRQKWNGFSQHLAAVVNGNIDVAVLSLFSTLASVSVYSVYYSVVYGVSHTIAMAMEGLEALLGNMIAKKEEKALLETFEIAEWLVHTVVAIVFTITGITVVSFVLVYTRGVHDANYGVPLFGMLLTVAYEAQCLRAPYFSMIRAAGHFKETQNGAYVSMMINIVLSVALVFRYGLIGTAIGTLAAMLYHTCYFVWYLKKSILKRPAWLFLRYLVTDALIYGIVFYLTKSFAMPQLSWAAWVVYAAKVGIVTVLASVPIQLLVYRDTAVAFVKRIKRS